MKRLLFAAATLVAATTSAFAQPAQGTPSQPAGPQAGATEQGGAWRLVAGQTTAIGQAQPQATEKKP